ncbi:MAG: HAD family hydrolase [Desulfobulbaceae bacterium]|uniref:phosphoglycolate phosphatase n=1 Tax=Candidatus Desulfatifera sulfidica TaxID=2841691 RepID=A0A8J6TAI9_9BACT|nr:HAD family hydrolase [Candidatus Desulfatifera sulfidica]
MLKLIIFDCDGVLFDSKNANRAYYNHLLQAFDRPAMDEAEVEYVHIHNVHESISHIFRHYPDQDIDALNHYRANLDYSNFFKYMRMEPDLIEFIEQTRDKYHLAISTNRTNTMNPLLKAFNLEQYFGKVMTAENARRPKPAPDALLEILDFYSCRVDEAIYIGDSIIDQQHSAGCDMRLIAFRNQKLNAAYHVNSFLEILELPPFNSCPPDS